MTNLHTQEASEFDFNKVPDVSCDAGYGVGLSGGCTEPFPEFGLIESASIATVRQDPTPDHTGIEDHECFLNHTVYTRIESWLDQVSVDQPFDNVLFFESGKGPQLQSPSFFNGTTLTPDQLVSATAVFCFANGDFAFDRQAIQMFLSSSATSVIYWGPKVRSLPLAASLDHHFMSLPSYTSNMDGEDDISTFEYESEGFSQATVEDNCHGCDDEANSESSFGCITAAAHDKAEKTRPRMQQLDVPPACPYLSRHALKYASSHEIPAPRGYTLKYIYVYEEDPSLERIAHPQKSFQRCAPRKDASLPLRVMHANMLDASIAWPTYDKNFADIQHLPAPRMQARPPRPGPGMLQTVHPEVRAQWETAKPLYLTCISRRPDPKPALHFPFERPPDSLRSLDLLGPPSATAFDRSLQPEPLLIPSLIASSWYLGSGVVGMARRRRAFEREELRKRKERVLKPFGFLRKMLHAITRSDK